MLLEAVLRPGPELAWLDRANAVTVTYGRSEGNNAFYVRAGFAF